MDRGGSHSLKILCLLSIIVVEVDLVLGRPKCIGKWAVHSCGGGNGKRSDIPDDESLPENLLPGFVSPELKIIGDRVDDENDGSQMEDNSFRQSISQAKERDFEERLEEDWQALVRRLLKEKMMEDEEEEKLNQLLRSL